MSDTRIYSTLSVHHDTHLKLKQMCVDKQRETGEKWSMQKLMDYLVEKELNNE